MTTMIIPYLGTMRHNKRGEAVVLRVFYDKILDLDHMSRRFRENAGLKVATPEQVQIMCSKKLNGWWDTNATDCIVGVGDDTEEKQVCIVCSFDPS